MLTLPNKYYLYNKQHIYYNRNSSPISWGHLVGQEKPDSEPREQPEGWGCPEHRRAGVSARLQAERGIVSGSWRDRHGLVASCRVPLGM